MAYALQLNCNAYDKNKYSFLVFSRLLKIRIMRKKYSVYVPLTDKPLFGAQLEDRGGDVRTHDTAARKPNSGA